MFEIIVFQEKPFYNKTLMVIVVQIVTYFSLLLNNKQYFFCLFCRVPVLEYNIEISVFMTRLVHSSYQNHDWYFLSLYNTNPTILCCISLRSLGVYNVKCLCSRGLEWGKEGGTPSSISIFDFYDIKTLWFEFGHDIFTGFKMPTL